MYNPSREEITERLQKLGIYPTLQRVEIAQILLARPQHMSADQVLQAVNRGEPVVSKATVYNTLGLFAEKGLVREVIVDPSKVFYDSNTHGHHHFYNVDTGQLSDVEASELSLGQLPAPPQGTELDTVEVIIRVRNQA